MATDSFVQVDADGSGKKVATAKQTIGANDVEVQYVAQFALDLLHGYSVAHIVAAAGTNATIVKNAPGQVYGYRAYNQAGYPVFVKLHNVAVAPTAGSGVKETIGLEAGLPDREMNPVGTPFDTGIGVTIVKGLPDSDVAAVAANDVVIDLFYK